MKLVKLKPYLLISDRDWNEVEGLSKGGELARLYDELIDGKAKSGEGTAQIIEGVFKDLWVWVYPKDYIELSPLEQLARAVK